MVIVSQKYIKNPDCYHILKFCCSRKNPLITAQDRLRPELKKWDIAGQQMISRDLDTVFLVPSESELVPIICSLLFLCGLRGHKGLP